uniref:SJCHGC07841 protein n=1 Tax=Schistosoma japonicum TaxID=6182 RepID=Q5BRL8_SCHJA|nr:SJCHGC07841 protein [Schistosoma japonicum]
MLRFEKVLLRKVQIGFLSFNVREFVPYALHCFKWQRMGHVASQCKGKKRCAKCGGEHDYGESGSNVKVKCCSSIPGTTHT